MTTVNTALAPVPVNPVVKPPATSASTVPQQTANNTRIQNRISFLRRQRPNDPEIARLRRQMNTVTTQPVGGTTPVATPPPVAPAPQAPAPANPNVAKALFPGAEAFLPQNFESSPLYQFQKSQGLADLNKMYAARGLTGSGAEIAGNSRFLNELGATEAQRAYGAAQNNADRLYQLQENAANRGERNAQNQFSNLFNILELASRQSPMNYAYQGTNSLGDLTLGQGKANSAYTNNNYRRVVSGGGGGGGGVPPMYIPPDTGPDYSSLPLLDSLYGGQTGQDWGSVISSGLAGLFK